MTNLRTSNVMKLIFSIIICQSAGLIGSIFTFSAIPFLVFQTYKAGIHSPGLAFRPCLAGPVRANGHFSFPYLAKRLEGRTREVRFCVFPGPSRIQRPLVCHLLRVEKSALRTGSDFHTLDYGHHQCLPLLSHKKKLSFASSPLLSLGLIRDNFELRNLEAQLTIQGPVRICSKCNLLS